MKKTYIASDHAGFKLKEQIKEELMDMELIDLGPSDETRVDYPDFAQKLCDQLKIDTTSFGILICGSGQGMAMKANRNSHIRAALCYSEDVAAISRAHNNANVICLGARFIDKDEAIKVLKAFFTADFEGGRHLDRVKKL